MKMAHGLVNGRHCATFGSMARHISDLSDLDANWFTLLGGNDGWLGSANYCDQLPLWQERRYIRMPLRLETIAREFPTALMLSPAAATTEAAGGTVDTGGMAKSGVAGGGDVPDPPPSGTTVG